MYFSDIGAILTKNSVSQLKVHIVLWVYRLYVFFLILVIYSLYQSLLVSCQYLAYWPSKEIKVTSVFAEKFGRPKLC